MILACNLFDSGTVYATRPRRSHSGQAIEQCGDNLLPKRPIQGMIGILRAVEVDDLGLGGLDMGQRVRKEVAAGVPPGK